MTGRELLKALQDLDDVRLDYPVLIGIEERWLPLESMTFDFNMKTIDLQGEK